MSMEIDALFIEHFDSEVKRAYGQTSMLTDTVNKKTNVKGESCTFQKKGKGLATRHSKGSDVVAMNTKYAPVKCMIDNWQAFDYVDVFDEDKINFNEVTELAEVASDALGLRMDQLIIDALENGYDSTNRLVGDATKALDVSVLLSAMELLDNAGVPESDRTFIHSAKQKRDLLNTTQITSADYNSVKALTNGEIKTFLGFKFVCIAARDEGGLPKIGDNGRLGFVYHKAAVGFALGTKLKTMMDWVAEKLAWQVGGIFAAGAVVIDDQGVIGVQSVA